MPEATTDSHWEIHQSFFETSQKIADALNSSAPIGQILLNREIKSLSEAYAFLKPNTQLSEPCVQTKVFHQACQLIQATCSKNKHILLIGDYDVDGVCASVMFHNFIKLIGGYASIRIPNRLSEGYGLGTQIVQEIIHKKPDLIITLDCGISNRSEFDILNKHHAIHSIIFDHHQIPATLPSATCIINPKLEEKTHPHYNLCAAGLVYTFLCFFKEHYQNTLELDEFLNLATLATVADIVPLTGDNRKIVFQGQRQLQQTQSLGLRALLDVCHLHKDIVSSRDIGFGIGPRINAAGRLKDAALSVRLLLSNTQEQAYTQATEIDRLNQKRKALCEQTLQEAKQLVKDHDLPVIALAKEGWHAGIIGITASQLMRTYYKPTILIAIQGNIARGSARSIPTVNMYEILKACRSCFESFGGHHQAAGFSIQPKNIPAFLEQLKSMSLQSIPPKDLIENIKIDLELPPQYIHLDFLVELEKLEPFGMQNPEPIFYSKNLQVLDYRLLGNQQQHLKLSLAYQNHCFEAIGFNQSHLLEYCHKKSIQCVYKLQKNIFNGIETVQLEIIDIR